MVTAQQVQAPLLTPQFTAAQNSPQLRTAQAPAPYTPYVAPTQAFDLTQLFNLIIPIFALGLVMALLMPMMKGFTEGFGGR
jgi:hypothetical protein